jgi:hypothetical protein
MPDKKRRSSIWTVIILTIVIIVFVLIIGKVMPASSPAASTDMAPSEEPVAAIEADALLAAYARDAVSADAAYKEKLLDVAGTVKMIGVDLGGSPFITLRSDEQAGNVQCVLRFDLTTIGMAAELSAGDIVVLRGRLKSRSGDVVMGDCIIVQILRNLVPK